jgi:hypothetical protein
MSRKAGSYYGSGTSVSGKNVGWFTQDSTLLPRSDAKGLPAKSAKRQGKFLKPVGDAKEPPRLIKRSKNTKPAL